MSDKVKVLLGIVLFAAVIAGAVFAYQKLSEAAAPGLTDPAEGEGTDGDNGSGRKTAPDFTVTGWDGGQISLSEFEGQPVVVNFWASWCPPCKSEMPDFDAVYQELGGEVVFMMINMTDGNRETVQTARAFIEKTDYTFPVYFDEGQKAAGVYGVRSIPTTVFIDRQGRIAAQKQGSMSEQALRAGIEKIR